MDTPMIIYLKMYSYGFVILAVDARGWDFTKTFQFLKLLSFSKKHDKPKQQSVIGGCYVQYLSRVRVVCFPKYIHRMNFYMTYESSQP
jgi:hypothetical protein